MLFVEEINLEEQKREKRETELDKFRGGCTGTDAAILETIPQVHYQHSQECKLSCSVGLVSSKSFEPKEGIVASGVFRRTGEEFSDTTAKCQAHHSGIGATSFPTRSDLTCGTTMTKPQRQEVEKLMVGLGDGREEKGREELPLGAREEILLKLGTKKLNLLKSKICLPQVVVLASLLAVGYGAPQFFSRGFPFTPRPFRPAPAPQPYHNRHIATIRDFREDQGNGNFRYEFETENGINVNAVGRPGSKGQSNIAGSFSFPFPEGGSGSLSYVADEFGFRPESPLIPTAPPLPAHAVEQIRTAEQQRARGIRFD
ncbi:uncharacterized protein [Macrobrachium rosenbergii]|uniref:uncharacterized protein n=1 Tax=Macrobrachium rosenbergii TaxID=79674 RepID=UPI0034D44B0C